MRTAGLEAVSRLRHQYETASRGWSLETIYIYICRRQLGPEIMERLEKSGCSRSYKARKHLVLKITLEQSVVSLPQRETLGNAIRIIYYNGGQSDTNLCQLVFFVTNHILVLFSYTKIFITAIFECKFNCLFQHILWPTASSFVQKGIWYFCYSESNRIWLVL